MLYFIRYFIFSYFLAVTFNSLAQPTKELSPYLKKEYYTPYTNSKNDFIKTVHVAIHVWQRGDGSGNLKDTPELYTRMNRVIGWMNDMYRKNYEAQDPPLPYPVDTIYDSKIRFELEGIYFYKDVTPDSAYCYSTRYMHNKKLDAYLEKNFPNRARTLNLHIYRGSYIGAAGYSVNGSVATFYRTNPDMDFNDVHDYWLSKHWAHEIGHGFDLWHTYDVEPNYQQNCNPKYTDFLWDLYDTTKVDTKGSCKIPLIPGKQNNNLMGGGSGLFMTVQQMGIAHRATVLKNLYNQGYNMRDFVTGHSPWSKEIDTNETWNISMKMYQNIVIKEGVTLTVKTEIQMVPQVKIIIEKGGTLLVDGGKITNEHYYQKKWKGIKCRKASKKSGFSSGKVELIHGGQILFGKVK